ncbi:MAG: hypothetical protein AAB589_01920 [Patescibacteria group bacterium]
MDSVEDLAGGLVSDQLRPGLLLVSPYFTILSGLLAGWFWVLCQRKSDLRSSILCIKSQGFVIGQGIWWAKQNRASLLGSRLLLFASMRDLGVCFFSSGLTNESEIIGEYPFYNYLTRRISVAHRDNAPFWFREDPVQYYPWWDPEHHGLLGFSFCGWWVLFNNHPVSRPEIARPHNLSLIFHHKLLFFGDPLILLTIPSFFVKQNRIGAGERT